MPTAGRVPIAIAAAVLLVALLTGPSATPAQAPARIRVGDTVSFTHLGLYVALERGLFKKRGVEVERISMPGGAKVLTTLLSGDIDVGDLSTVNVLRAQIENRPAKIIGATYNMEIWALMVASGLKGKITTLADLKERTVGVTSIGAGSWGFANLAARAAGLDPARDIKIVPLGNISAILGALKSGKVDTAVTWEPGTSRGLAEGIGYTLIDVQDPRQHREFMGADESLVEVMAALEPFVRNNGDTLRKFFAALNEAYDWLHAQSIDEVARTVAPIAGESNMEALRASVKRALPGVPKTSVVGEHAYTVAAQKLHQGGATREVIPFARAVDNSVAGAR
jgi:ABC-type nitrate/sulfonate/bicarbonate transport system substrate-binding protein